MSTNTDATAKSASENAYDVIKADILTCRHRPGAALYEGDISSKLGVSKTPVREALGALTQEGLVVATPRQGYRVADITLADVQEIFQLRLLLEPAAAELAAERANPEQLQRLRELAEMDAHSDYVDNVMRIRQFHSALAAASGNSRLAYSLERLLDGAQRLYYAGLNLSPSVGDHIDGHRELVDAIIKGNHHLAAKMAREHVESDRLKVIDAILASLSGPNPNAATALVGVFNPD